MLATEPLAATAEGLLEGEVVEFLRHALRPVPAPQNPGATAGRAPAERIHDLLTHRRFCALSRGRAGRHRAGALEILAGPVQRGEPVEFWYDIGPGYHASLRPGLLPLSFAAGLGEYLMLGQVAAFVQGIGAIYAPGARFRLVVDNLCALHTNAIGTERTGRYCAELRQLIAQMGLAEQVRLFVESEEFDAQEYRALLRETADQPISVQASQADLDNVVRFLGRRCSHAEALERIGLYARATAATERLLAKAVRGVRLTQRATDATLGFRSFPGGDARIQCGEVVLLHDAEGGIVPTLLTSRNVDLYERARLALPPGLPAAIRSVGLAARRPQAK